MASSTARLERKARRSTAPAARAIGLCDLAWAMRNSEPRRAAECAAEALAIAESERDEHGIARSKVVLGTLHVFRSERDKATEVLSEALATMEEDSDHVGALRALVGLMHVAIEGNELDRARDLARRALSHGRASGDRRLEHDAIMAQVQLSMRCGEYDRSRGWLAKAAAIDEELGDDRHAVQLAAGGQLAFLTDAPADAAAAFREAIELTGRSGNLRQRCFVLMQLCRVEAELGDYTGALEHAMECARLSDPLDMNATLARAYTAIGIVHKRFGDYDRAREFAERSQAIALGLGNRMLVASSLNAIANCLFATKRYDEALAAYGEAELIAEEIDDAELLSDLRLNMGNVRRDQRMFDEAFELYSSSLAIAHDLGDSQRHAELHLNMGRLQGDQGLFDTAIESFEECRARASAIGNLELLSLANRELAEAYGRRGADGDGTRAYEHLREYMRLKEELTSAQQQREIAARETRAMLERIERDREVERLERERLALDNQHRVEELTALGVHLAERNEMIRTVAERLREALGCEDGERESVLRSLLSSLGEHESTESEWQSFEQRMQTVHHGFLVELSRRYPSLKPAELKVSALLRTQLSTKEIASLLGVTERAIEKHRYAIRRKLELGAETNLVAFLTAMR